MTTVSIVWHENVLTRKSYDCRNHGCGLLTVVWLLITSYIYTAISIRICGVDIQRKLTFLLPPGQPLHPLTPPPLSRHPYLSPCRQLLTPSPTDLLLPWTNDNIKWQIEVNECDCAENVNAGTRKSIFLQMYISFLSRVPKRFLQLVAH